ncbi:MAG TPA: RNA 2',3'-cyclic phosphodiesterase [Chthoniobacteraceae bacterium]|nr:RNA 2',3'-cyclic phosphodiesterase [Chthoniobacteraceae bacterium]
MPKRLFIGLELPPPLRETLAALDPRIKGLRWLPAEQMHLTMSFLGDVDRDAEELLRDALAPVRVGEFFLPVEGMGAFGGARPTVVWAGVGKGHPHLFALHKHIQDAVLHAGLEADLKPFHPHITIGRVPRGSNLSRQVLLPFLRKHADVEFGLCKITGFTLFSSMLSPQGASHNAELRVTF